MEVVFIKTKAPVEPVALVRKICEDAVNEPERKRTRFVKRLSPMTLMGRASAEGLEKVAREVLAPHFHCKPFQSRKVRNLRTNSSWRDCVDCIGARGEACANEWCRSLPSDRR